MLLEAFFIRINIGRVSELHSELAKRTLKADTSLIENLIKKSGREEEFHSLLEDVNKRVTIIEMDGKVIYDSAMYKREGSMDYHSERPEILEAMERGQGFDVRYSKTLGNQRAYYAEITKDLDGTEYVVRTSLNYESDYKDIKDLLIA